MNSAYALVGVLAKLHDDIDQSAALAQSDVAKHVSHCRRSIAQRFRKLSRDLDHDQNSH